MWSALLLYTKVIQLGEVVPEKRKKGEQLCHCSIHNAMSLHITCPVRCLKTTECITWQSSSPPGQPDWEQHWPDKSGKTPWLSLAMYISNRCQLGLRASDTALEPRIFHKKLHTRKLKSHWWFLSSCSMWKGRHRKSSEFWIKGTKRKECSYWVFNCLDCFN